MSSDAIVVDPKQRAEILQYLSLEEKQLFSILGAYAKEGSLFSPEGQAEAGKHFFESIRRRLVELVCDQWSACKKMKDPRFDDTVTLVSTLGDVVASIAVGVPPLTIAVLITKIGVRTLCSCESESN